jgi:hypothetical protein
MTQIKEKSPSHIFENSSRKNVLIFCLGKRFFGSKKGQKRCSGTKKFLFFVVDAVLSLNT